MSEPATNSAPAPRRRLASWLLGALILAAAGAATTYYLRQFLHDVQNERQHTVSAMQTLRQELDARMNTLQANTQAEQERHHAGVSQLTAEYAKLETQLAAQAHSLSKMQAQLDHNPEVVLLQRASLQLELAHAALTARQAGTAIAALSALTAEISPEHTLEWQNLRATLQQKIAALETLPQLDFAALDQRLQQAAKNLQTLPLKTTAGQPATSSANANQTGWKQLAATVWQDLRGLVELSQAELPASMLLSADQAALLRERMQLECSLLRMYLLRADETALRRQISAVQKNLQEYYDPQHADARALQSLLQGLADTALTPALPDISAERAWVNSRLRQLPANTPTPAPPPASGTAESL